jgi:methionyl-tRNA synthetase
MKNKKILITSALPYVNNVPHLGNIIGCVLSADVFARYCRSQNYDCMYICGTDEYGTATEIKALEEGLSPKEITDKYYAIHKDIYEWFGIKFDEFGRTSTEKHTEITHDILNKLNEQGLLVDEEVEQLYDNKAKMFLADRYIEGTCPYCGYEESRADQCDKCGKLLHAGELRDPISKVTKTKPVVKKSKHLFFNLPKLEGALNTWIDEASEKGFWSQNSTNIAKAWLRDGLKKRAITRDLKWGVSVPLKGYEKKCVYVWFEAPIGYISITANHTGEWEKWWLNPDEVELYQFMGKDNVPFHTVIFPATLMGTQEPYTMLHHINTTEYLTYEGGKFSKSRSIGVFGDDAVNSGIPSDVWRYYLLTNRPEASDSDFTWEDFRDKNNAELLANLGNLVNRTMVFVNNNFEGVVPTPKLNNDDQKFLDEQAKVIQEVTELLEKVKIKEALHSIMHLTKNANKYFQDNKPWVLIKEDIARAGTVLYVLINQLKDLAILIEPYIPHTSERILKQLNIDKRYWEDLTELSVDSAHHIGKAEILFTKLEDKEIEGLKKKFHGKKKEEEMKFSDLDLEVGEIISCERHPDAEKLFVERVKLGEGERQIVSGLADYYFPENLVGRKVIVVKNLKSAKLRGLESQGMILAAEGREKTPGKGEVGASVEQDVVEVLFADESEVGDKVHHKGQRAKEKNEIDIKQFSKIEIVVDDFSVVSEGKPLITKTQGIKTQNIKKGVVS